MWYLAELLFAEPLQPDHPDCQCESSNVLFEAGSAIEAYRKAVSWGLAYAAEPPAGMRLLGVSHLTTVGDELGDGTEVCGRLFSAQAVWDRIGELIPPPERLKAIQWERGEDTPIGELLSPEQLSQLRRAWAQDPEQGAFTE